MAGPLKLSFSIARALLELVVEVAPGGDHLAPLERVADAADGLPRDIGIARAHVCVVRDEPFAIGAEAQASFHTNDGVPIVGLLLRVSAPRRARARGKVRTELPVERFLDRKQAGAGKDIERQRRVRHRRILAGEGHDRTFEVAVQVRGHAERQRLAANGQVTRLRAVAAHVEVHEVDEPAPPGPARLEKAHERELEIVEEGVGVDIDAASRAVGKPRLAPDGSGSSRRGWLGTANCRSSVRWLQERPIRGLPQVRRRRG